MATDKDVVGMLNEAATEMDRMAQRNQLLEAQMRVVRIFEMALQGRDGGMMSPGQWPMSDRLRMLANKIESDAKDKAGTAAPTP